MQPSFLHSDIPRDGSATSSNQRTWPLEKRAVKILAAILPHARTKLFAPDEAGRARMFILKRTPTTESTLSARPWVGSERGSSSVRNSVKASHSQPQQAQAHQAQHDFPSLPPAIPTVEATEPAKETDGSIPGALERGMEDIFDDERPNHNTPTAVVDSKLEIISPPPDSNPKPPFMPATCLLAIDDADGSSHITSSQPCHVFIPKPSQLLVRSISSSGHARPDPVTGTTFALLTSDCRWSSSAEDELQASGNDNREPSGYWSAREARAVLNVKDKH
ncbi:uncharacterized protein PAC_01890 [Phialocephala subalpina]|uniref:Uncharacterized protein n=1 Tax=Phialocephala subalpina TaxID=576137 RepID=A0A1L7WGY8_9HELO|nr:uncharacterized protein PAC_01890 [Phialocephala subalpina]